ncbi:DnaJ molecular chaperone homology domain, partial [Rhizoctonia solani]
MASHLYETLNLGMNATPDEIRKAYKKLALKTHPDRAPPERKLEAEEEFRKVNAAYEVLIDEEKRRIYDRNGVYPPPEPATENAYSNPYSPPPNRSQPPPTFSRPSFERHSRRHAPRPDPFAQMFNEPPFPATAPPGSGPFGMQPMFHFTDPFKMFHDVFASAMPPLHMHPNMRYQPMYPIVGGPDLFLDSDRIQPFRSTDPNIIWTEETRTTKIINGHHQTIHTLVDKDGNVRRSYDVDGKHWETFNDQIIQPYEALYDTHHERIDFAPHPHPNSHPPSSSHGRSRKPSTGRKSRHGSPGYPYVSATPQPIPVPPTHHVRTKSQHIPTRHSYRRMYSYSEEDLGSPVSDTENIRPYSYEFAPTGAPRQEEHHYPAAASEYRSKRHYEQAVPPTPPRDLDPAHRRAMRPDGVYKTGYPDREPPTYMSPNPEHEVKEKRWWHRFRS